MYLYTKHRVSSSADLRLAMASGFRDTFIFVLLLHPTVSGQAFAFFRCRAIEGTSYLMADYSLTCYDGSWNAYAIFVALVLVVFSLGAPLAVASVLYSHRDTLQTEDFKERLGMLYTQVQRRRK